MSKSTGPNKENFDKTNERFLAVARGEFIAHGFASASTNRMVEKSAMARGTLYYHFKDKRGIFAAVFKNLQHEILTDIRAAARNENDPWTGFKAACNRYLELCARPDIRQIILMDGPTVLDLRDIRLIEAETTLGTLYEGIRGLSQRGYFKGLDPKPLSLLIYGALESAGRTVALSPDIASRDATIHTLDAMLERLGSNGYI